MAKTKKGSNSSGTLDMTAELIQPTETPQQNPETVSFDIFQNLQQTYFEKCKECDSLARAYAGLQQKSATDIAALKHLLKGLNLSVELLWPTSKGE